MKERQTGQIPLKDSFSLSLTLVPVDTSAMSNNNPQRKQPQTKMCILSPGAQEIGGAVTRTGSKGEVGSPDPALQLSVVTISRHLARILDDLAIITCEIEDIRARTDSDGGNDTSHQ